MPPEQSVQVLVPEPLCAQKSYPIGLDVDSFTFLTSIPVASTTNT
jgi:hypothetical protein